MSNFNTCFTCKICDNFFVDPIILPCGHSVCKSHVEKKEQFICQICSIEHTIFCKSLIPNKFIEEILTTKIYENLSEKKRQKILNSFSLLEKVIHEIENLEKNPDHFVAEFFDGLIKKIDLRREEIIVEIEEHYRSGLTELNDLKNKLNYFQIRKLTKWFTRTELNNFKQNTKTNEELVICCLDSFEKKKEEQSIKIEKLYIDLLSEMKKDCNNYLDLSKTKKLVDSVKTKIQTIKNNMDELSQNIFKILINENIYDATKKKINDDREFINNSIRDFKNTLLSNKGFELESKVFGFPELNDTFSAFLNKKFKAEDLKGKQRGNIFMSNKSVFKGIPFYVGLKLEKNNYLYACLYCSNEFEFSGIDVNYKISEIVVNYRFQNYGKSFKFVFRHFGSGFKKLKKITENTVELNTNITFNGLINRENLTEGFKKNIFLIDELSKTVTEKLELTRKL